MKAPFLMGVGCALLAGSVGGAYAAQSSTHQEKSVPSGVMMVPLHHGEASNRQDVIYHCQDNDKKDEHAGKDLLKSLPEGGRFTVSYLNADMTALAVLPVDGNMLAMANVIAGSGAKYVADRYSWATQGDEATFTRVDRDGMSVSCRVVSETEEHAKAEPAGAPANDAPSKEVLPVQQLKPSEHTGGSSSSAPAKATAPSTSHHDGDEASSSTSHASVAPSASPSASSKPSSSQDMSKGTQSSQH